MERNFFESKQPLCLDAQRRQSPPCAAPVDMLGKDTFYVTITIVTIWVRNQEDRCNYPTRRYTGRHEGTWIQPNRRNPAKGVKRRKIRYEVQWRPVRNFPRYSARSAVAEGLPERCGIGAFLENFRLIIRRHTRQRSKQQNADSQIIHSRTMDPEMNRRS